MDQAVRLQTNLEADGLTIRRGGKVILENVSARFASGTLTAVIGPNGAGKSTLLAALAGLIAPSAGTATLDGVSLHRLPRRALARRRAYLPQNARCEWPLAVERVVALGLTPILPVFGSLSQDDEARITRALEAVDMAGKRHQGVDTLSGGELARAMLARAMVGDPDILMVDEPTTGLDPRHALDAMTRLKAVAASGRLVLTAIHDLPLALRFVDRLIALRDGRIVADGAPAEIVTPALLKTLYDVEAEIGSNANGVSVRFLG